MLVIVDNLQIAMTSSSPFILVCKETVKQAKLLWHSQQPICFPTFVTCQDLPGVYWYLMLYLPPYTINNRLQRAWLKSVSFQVSRLCRSGMWESKWQMAFNADKCFVIRAGTKRKAIKQDYTIHNHILEV
jgi:hypothetical protein